MTDLRTRPFEELRRHEAASGSRTVTRGKILVLTLVGGVLLGWLAFASAGPSHAELEQARWQQVVDYHERQYQTVVDTQVRNEALWEAVVEYHEQRWELEQS